MSTKKTTSPKRKVAPTANKTDNRTKVLKPAPPSELLRALQTRDFRIQSTVLSKESLSEIRKYLENPTKSGIWFLEGKLNQSGGISDYIWESLQKKLKGKSAKAVMSSATKVSINITEDEKLKLHNRIFSKISFLTSLFAYMNYLDGRPVDIREYANIVSGEDLIIFDFLDVPNAKAKFSEAYEYFKAEIFFDGFRPRVLKNQPFQIKDGMLILTERSEHTNSFSCVSTDAVHLEKFRTFLEMIGKVSEHSIMPVFSPEETVFAPYFVLLNVSFKFLIGDKHNSSLFSKAFEEYSNDRYTSCVSTIGLIAEDYLTQIYETLFRESCPKSLTLGQIYDWIHSSLAKKFQPETKSLSDLTPMYDQIKAILKKAESNSDNLDNAEIIILVRQVLNSMKEDREYFRQAISNLNRKPEAISCFTKELKENLIELIRYRNSASHKTRVPIGSYEAIKSVYFLISLYLWWEAEKKLIDWKDDLDAILKSIVNRNSKLQIK